MYSQLTYSGSESAVNSTCTMIETHSSGGSSRNGLVVVLNRVRLSSDKVNPTENLECAGSESAEASLWASCNLIL